MKIKMKLEKIIIEEFKKNVADQIMDITASIENIEENTYDHLKPILIEIMEKKNYFDLNLIALDILNNIYVNKKFVGYNISDNLLNELVKEETQKYVENEIIKYL